MGSKLEIPLKEKKELLKERFRHSVLPPYMVRYVEEVAKELNLPVKAVYHVISSYFGYVDFIMQMIEEDLGNRINASTWSNAVARRISLPKIGTIIFSYRKNAEHKCNFIPKDFRERLIEEDKWFTLRCLKKYNKRRYDKYIEDSKCSKFTKEHYSKIYKAEADADYGFGD